MPSIVTEVNPDDLAKIDKTTKKALKETLASDQDAVAFRVLSLPSEGSVHTISEFARAGFTSVEVRKPSEDGNGNLWAVIYLTDDKVEVR